MKVTILTSIDNNKVIVTDETLRFTIKGKWYTIPEGFASDGMSVPKFFYRVLSPAIDPVTLEPSVIHDYLYSHTEICTRQEADEWYRDHLIEDGFAEWKAYTVYYGLRLFGSSHWGTN